MANNRVSVVVDIKAQADNLNQIINQSKKNLQTLSPNMDPKQANNLMRQFDTLQSKIEATKNKLASGLNTQAAFTKASQDINRFGQDYTSIIQKIQGMGIDPKKIIPKTAEVEAEMKKLTDLYEQQGKIAGQKYGQGISKELNKELRKAAQSGDTKGVQDIGKKAANDLTAKNRSLIAQRGQITKFYGQEAEKKIEAELVNQRNILATQGQGAQKAQAQKFGKNIGQLEADLKVVNQHKAYQQNHQAIVRSTQAYAQQATQLNSLQIEIDETTGKISIMAKPARDEAAQALNQLGNSSQQAKTQIDSMNNSLDRSQQEFTETAQKAKSMSQLKSYFSYFFSVGTMINYASRAIRGAIKDFKELDKLFNEISIVTGTSMDELWSRFSRLNNLAQEYGVTTKDVVSVQKLYYQQGRSTAEITRLTGETLKFAKISGLEFADATNYMTSVINAYKIAAEDAVIVTDTFAALSANAAVDSKELATAISKTASLAANAGSDFQDTSAYLTKIIETTREAPETAGTALKTIIARFSEVKDLTEEESELLDEGYNFNNIEKALKTVGIQSKDANGQIRGFSDILNDLGPIWDDLTVNQQRYIATAAAGARQQSRFIALMDDWGRTQELQGVASESAGTGGKQLALSLDSIETAMNKLKSTWQEFYANFLNSDWIKGGINLLNKLLSVLNDIGNMPVIGFPALVLSVTILTSLVKKAFRFGKDFGRAFSAGKIAEEKKAEAQHAASRATKEAADAKTTGNIAGTIEAGEKVKQEEIIEAGKTATDLAEAVPEATALGGVEGETKAKTQVATEETIENAKAAVDLTEAGVEGTNEGLLKGKNKGIAQTQGERLGRRFGKIKNSKFVQGTIHPFATFSGTGGAATAGAATAGTAGTTAVGAAGIAGAVIGVAALGALITAAVFYGISKWRQAEEREVLEIAEKTTENINKSVDKITNISNNYLKALELQKKGLAQTTEEMEEYQSSLKTLQESYPQMIKVLSDGTLALAENAETIYLHTLGAERDNIRRQTQSVLEVTGDKVAVSSGLALTAESKTLQEEIKNIAANMSSMSIDQLDAMGTEGFWGDSITSEDLALITEKGLNRQTLDEAIESTIFGEMTQEDYENLLKTMAGQEGGDYDTESQEYKLVEAIASMSSKTKEDFAKTLIEGSGDKGAWIQEGQAIAQSFAAETQTVISDVLSDTVTSVYGKVTDRGQASIAERQMKAFFQETEGSKQKFNNYTESIMSDMALEDIGEIKEVSDVVEKFGMSYDAARFAFEGIKTQQEEFNKALKTEKDRYKDATGEALDTTDSFFSEMGLRDITNYVRQVSDVASKYGKEAGKNFEKSYRTFVEDTINGNQKLLQTFGKTDFFDNQSIAQTAAYFMEATGSCEEFLEVANKTSKVADRGFRNLEQFSEGMVKDIGTIKDSFEKLGQAIDGELELEDAITLVGKMGGELSFSDFTATSNGYKLSEEQALEFRDKLLDLKVNEYKIEMELNAAKMEQLKAEILSNEAIQGQTALNAANFDQVLAALQVRLTEGKVVGALNDNLYNTLKVEGLLVKMTELLSLSGVLKESEILIEQFELLNITFDRTNTSFGKAIAKLEKILELLGKVDYYSDINAYLDNLQTKIDAIDFTIEFTSNAEAFAEATKEKFFTMNKQITANMAKSNKAEERMLARRKEFEEGEFKQFVSFDEEGNLLTNGAEIEDWANRIAEMAASEEEYTKAAADDEQKKLELLLEQIEAYREEKKIMSESEREAQKLLQEQEKLTKELRENVVELEDTFRELFIARDEEILENLEERYDKMKEMDDEYLETVREAVEEERRLRDQNKAYDDVAQMERKLALLQMGGGSAVEIQQLQEEIKEARQDIADTEQDNILDNIEKENEKRAVAMDEEVEYRQAVLEQKKEDQRLYNEEIEILMKQEKETIMKTWQELDNEYKAASDINKQIMYKNMEDIVTKGQGSAETLADESIQYIEDAYTEVKTNGIDTMNAAMDAYLEAVRVGSNGAAGNIEKIENAYFKAGLEIDNLLEKQRKLNEELGISVDHYSNPNNFKIDEDGDDDSPFQTMYTVAEAYTLGGNHSKTYYKLIDDQGNVSWIAQANVGDLTVGGVFKGNAEHIKGTKDKFDSFKQTKINFYKGENKENVRDFGYEWTDFYDENGDQYKFMRLDFSTLSKAFVEKETINGFMEKNGVLLLRLEYPITTTDGDILYWLDYVDATDMDLTDKSQDELKLQLREYTDYYTPKEKNSAMTYSEAYERWLKSNGKKYATGGMVDYTGPAWVDGTKSRPEAFLSANDTQLIASLRDILRAGVSPTAFASSSIQKSGDTYYTIHINVDELGDGYSVDDLVEEMEERILQATGQSNVVKITR